MVRQATTHAAAAVAVAAAAVAPSARSWRSPWVNPQSNVSRRRQASPPPDRFSDSPSPPPLASGTASPPSPQPTIDFVAGADDGAGYQSEEYEEEWGEEVEAPAGAGEVAAEAEVAGREQVEEISGAPAQHARDVMHGGRLEPPSRRPAALQCGLPDDEGEPGGGDAGDFLRDGQLLHPSRPLVAQPPSSSPRKFLKSLSLLGCAPTDEPADGFAASLDSATARARARAVPTLAAEAAGRGAPAPPAVDIAAEVVPAVGAAAEVVTAPPALAVKPGASDRPEAQSCEGLSVHASVERVDDRSNSSDASLVRGVRCLRSAV
jgi:hypothetical protein